MRRAGIKNTPRLTQTRSLRPHPAGERGDARSDMRQGAPRARGSRQTSGRGAMPQTLTENEAAARGALRQRRLAERASVIKSPSIPPHQISGDY